MPFGQIYNFLHEIRNREREKNKNKNKKPIITFLRPERYRNPWLYQFSFSGLPKDFQTDLPSNPGRITYRLNGFEQVT